ncbi:hypothetical protein KL941_005432, partial [Ogataea angusta]
RGGVLNSSWNSNNIDSRGKGADAICKSDIVEEGSIGAESEPEGEGDREQGTGSLGIIEVVSRWESVIGP